MAIDTWCFVSSARICKSRNQRMEVPQWSTFRIYTFCLHFFRFCYSYHPDSLWWTEYFCLENTICSKKINIISSSFWSFPSSRPASKEKNNWTVKSNWLQIKWGARIALKQWKRNILEYNFSSKFLETFGVSYKFEYML